MKFKTARNLQILLGIILILSIFSGNWIIPIPFMIIFAVYTLWGIEMIHKKRFDY